MQPPVRDSLSTTINVNNDYSPSRDTPPVDEKRVVRSIPPWVHTEDDDDEGDADDECDHRRRLLPMPTAIPASHHYLPAPPHQHRAPGRKWDHLRNAEPPMITQPIATNQERWVPYMLSGPHPRGVEGARIVSDEWMDENMSHMAVWEPNKVDLPSGKPKGLWLFSPARQRRTFGKIQVSAENRLWKFAGPRLIFICSASSSKILMFHSFSGLLSLLLPWPALAWVQEFTTKPTISNDRRATFATNAPLHIWL